jgi:hypothetical protein
MESIYYFLLVILFGVVGFLSPAFAGVTILYRNDKVRRRGGDG